MSTQTARCGPPDAGHSELAAMYVRMSTEHQQYSIGYQTAEITRYADAEGLRVVRTYVDEARSGLTLKYRTGLRQLMADVGSGKAKFGSILVYDVSRWGRFQDVDESAHYEYLCTSAGIRVIYCAEPFQNDGSAVTHIIKNIKRVMAAEFSRELSVKVFAAKERHARLGLHPGAAPAYGLRRILINGDGTTKLPLRRGERKALQTDRVRLVHGPAEEVEAVRWMFTAFAVNGLTQTQIVARLNADGPARPYGGHWTTMHVANILRNDRYAGYGLWNRTSSKLKGRRVCNPPDEWVRVPGVIEPVVPEALFNLAQARLAERRNRVAPEVMARQLGELLEQTGELSAKIINACPHIPSAATFARVFAGLENAYRRVGYEPRNGFIGAPSRRRTRQRSILKEIVEGLSVIGVEARLRGSWGCLNVNGEVTVIVKVVPAIRSATGAVNWLCANLKRDGHLYVLARELPEGGEDYYIFPRSKLPPRRFLIGRTTGQIPQAFRSDSLAPIFSVLARQGIGET